MKTKLFAILALSALLASPAFAGFYGANSNSGSDPCANPGILKLSVPVATTSESTFSLVAASGVTSVYVCGYQLTVQGAGTQTIQFVNAVNTPCVSTTPLSGAMVVVPAATPAAAYPAVANGVTGQMSGTLFKSAAGQSMCLTVGGASANTQGFVTYIQQ